MASPRRILLDMNSSPAEFKQALTDVVVEGQRVVDDYEEVEDSTQQPIYFDSYEQRNVYPTIQRANGSHIENYCPLDEEDWVNIAITAANDPNKLEELKSNSTFKASLPKVISILGQTSPQTLLHFVPNPSVTTAMVVLKSMVASNIDSNRNLSQQEEKTFHELQAISSAGLKSIVEDLTEVRKAYEAKHSGLKKLVHGDYAEKQPLLVKTITMIEQQIRMLEDQNLIANLRDNLNLSAIFYTPITTLINQNFSEKTGSSLNVLLIETIQKNKSLNEVYSSSYPKIKNSHTGKEREKIAIAIAKSLPLTAETKKKVRIVLPKADDKPPTYETASLPSYKQADRDSVPPSQRPQTPNHDLPPAYDEKETPSRRPR